MRMVCVYLELKSSVSPATIYGYKKRLRVIINLNSVNEILILDLIVWSCQCVLYAKRNNAGDVVNLFFAGGIAGMAAAGYRVNVIC